MSYVRNHSYPLGDRTDGETGWEKFQRMWLSPVHGKRQAKSWARGKNGVGIAADAMVERMEQMERDYLASLNQ
jgi:hypothetical protein